MASHFTFSLPETPIFSIAKYKICERMEFLFSQICILTRDVISLEKSKHHLSLTLNTKNQEPDGDKLSICLNIVMFYQQILFYHCNNAFLRLKLFEVS